MQRKLLIVDDEPLNISLLTEMLGRNAFTYFRAFNGEECLATSRAERPDLIILDWQMPLMDGLEALRHLKASEDTSDIPVLMVTGVMNSPEDLVVAMEEGAVDFLRKPFDRLELNARVRNMLLLSDSIRDLKEKYCIIESSNKLIQSLFKGVPHPLVYYNLDGQILQCNSLFEELTGVPATRLTGTMIYRYFSAEQSSFHFQQDVEMIALGSGRSYEGFLGDDQREFIFSKDLLSDFRGKHVGIISVMTDVSEIKRSHAELIEGKKRELVSSALRLIHISEINNNLITELEKINRYASVEGRELIGQMIQRNKITAAESVWQDFEARFENVYELFYNRLQEKCPDLTPGERKLCALLRLNISSKDIAAITFQNPQSVDMARYRLRKKLNLNPEDNLVDFLLKIDQ